MSTPRGFTLIELMVVIAIIGFLASTVFAVLSDARLDARDKRRIADAQQIQKALELYVTERGVYPKESEGANGDVSTNTTFLSLIGPYLQGTPVDPSGLGNGTFFYYYDGAHTCGTKEFAVLIVRQMDKPEHANYQSFLNDVCGGTLDGEGRGGGEESYNLIIGNSSG